MRIFVLLLVLVFSAFVYSQNTLQGNLYFSGEPCYSSESSTTSECPSESTAGFVAKENTCIYMHGIESTSMSYNVSSNGEIVESIYGVGDSFCNNPILSLTLDTGVCYQKCLSTNYLVSVNTVTNFQFPSSVLIINSKSQNCKNDWQSTYDFVQYYNLKTCIIDATGQNSFMLDCENNGMTVYAFSGIYCDTTPKVLNLPLNQNSCEQYQICNKIN